MQLDTATLLGAPEAAAATPAAPGADAAPVTDIFAALLSALAPQPAVAPEATGTAANDGETEPQAGQQAGQPATTGNHFAAGADCEGVAPLVATAGIEPGQHLEVLRDPSGLPLVPLVPAGSLGGQRLGVPADPAAPAGQDPSGAQGAAGTERHTPGNVSPTHPTLTPVAVDPEVTQNDGRPVPTTPEFSIASTRVAMPKPQSKDTGDNAVEPVIDAPADPEELVDPSTNGKTPVAVSTDAGTPVPTSDPRPAVWQPTHGTTPPTIEIPVGTTAVPGRSEVTPVTAQQLPEGSEAAPRPADPHQIKTQVLKQIMSRAEGTTGRPQQITLRLDPEHLGRVEVRLIASGNQLHVEFQAETAEASLALREGQQELVRNLSGQFGRFQQVDVKVVEAERASTDLNDKNEKKDERSEQGSRRERDHQQHRRQRGDR